MENINDKRQPKKIKTKEKKQKSIKNYVQDILGNLYEVKSKQNPQMIMKG